jgi:hypothetical protein
MRCAVEGCKNTAKYERSVIINSFRRIIFYVCEDCNTIYKNLQQENSQDEIKPCGYEYGDKACEKCKDRVACSY